MQSKDSGERINLDEPWDSLESLHGKETAFTRN